MKYAEYCQQIQHLKINLDDLPKILNERPIKMWAYCVHDKDTHEDGSHKIDHVHIMMKFNSDQVPENICKWFNDEPQRIEKAKGTNTKYTYQNMCSYLVHETPTSDGKYHYSDDEVVANFDFHQYMEDIRHGVQEAKEKRKKHPIEDVLLMICNDQIPRIRLDEHLTEMERIRYDKDIRKAYDIRDERKAKEVDRIMNVMYFHGDSGTFKTTVAKFMAKSKGYSVFVSGSSNDPLEGYLGQECIILDDLRGSDWKINDLLKMLDNNTNSLVKSRYSNKLLNDCKLIIITSVEDIDELYRNLKENNNEPIEQLKRRCRDYIDFTPSTMSMYQYDDEQRQYEYKGNMPNMGSTLVYMQQNVSLLDDLKHALTEEASMPWASMNINEKGAKNG